MMATTRTWQKSRSLLERARNALAGGVSSPVRARAAAPLYFADGQGSRLWDVDGNEYIDYLLAWGPMILGHKHPRLVEALQRQAQRPTCLGAQHETEIVVAEQIQRMVPSAERVAFTSSGSEAVQLAFRLARAFTGRPLILRFEGHYHGWMDSALISYRVEDRVELGPLESPRLLLGSRGQLANSTENVVVAPWNHLEIFEAILAANAARVAAVIMEPVLCNSGCILPEPAYLEGVRRLCTQHGALLIFDEVITGFRIDPGGAQKHYGVTPDVTTLGKAVAGGAPLSVVAGRAEILEQIAGKGVVFGGTFNGNPVSMASANAVLDELARDGGAALAHASRIGSKLISGIADLAASHGVALTITGFSTAFSLHFSRRARYRDYRDTLDDDKAALGRFLLLLLDEGVQTVPDGRLYVSAAHTAEDVPETLAAMDRAFARFVPASSD
jgi:glutamate-1-semialdehyde 2,1-aminomutase